MRQIKRITSFDACEGFVRRFCHDSAFSDPMLSNDEQMKRNLESAIEKTEHHLVLGVFDGERMVGLFSFLVLEDERYLEMLVGLSRDEEAYGKIFEYLQERFASYAADFVFNPNNALLRELLRRRGAEFDAEQQKMRFTKSAPDIDTSGVVPLSEEYIPSYLKLHHTGMYWTGDRVIEAADRFRVFVAVESGNVVGYLDATHPFDENEVYDLLVKEDCRRKGYGRKLVARALQRNQPNAMMLLVDVDHEAAIRLFESLGFERVEDQNSIAAYCRL